MKITVNTRGTRGFLEFVKRAMPTTYAQLNKELTRGAQLQGLGLTTPVIETATETPMSSSLAQTLKEIAQVAAQTYLTKEQIDAQNRILNVQLDRARQNLPPLSIDPQTYGLPSPSIGVGLTGDTKQLLIYGALGVAALWVFSSFMGRSRRA